MLAGREARYRRLGIFIDFHRFSMELFRQEFEKFEFKGIVVKKELLLTTLGSGFGWDGKRKQFRKIVQTRNHWGWSFHWRVDGTLTEKRWRNFLVPPSLINYLRTETIANLNQYSTTSTKISNLTLSWSIGVLGFLIFEFLGRRKAQPRRRAPQNIRRR